MFGVFILKKVLSLLLSFCLIVSFSATAFAKTVSSECSTNDLDIPLDETAADAVIGQTLDIKAKSCILMEVSTGKVLYEMNPSEQLAPASITKIMSLLLVFEAIDRGDIDLETVVSASEHACSMGGSQIWLEPGEAMTVDDLLKASVIASANDAITALGEHLYGSEEGFVAAMNAKAKELGLTGTTFLNCTGLDAEGHLTTAYDVAVMSKELIKHRLVKQYSTVWMDSLRDGESELVNTNKLVRFYKGTTGLKTGTTSIAKYCLSATAEREGMELVAVVMAGDSSTDRFEGAKKLLDFGFANFKNSVLDGNLKETEIDVKKGVLKTVQIECNDTVSVLLKKGASAEIKREIVWNEDITAPIKKGDVLGYVNIYMEEAQVGALKITAKEPVKKLTVMYAVLEIFKEIFQI